MYSPKQFIVSSLSTKHISASIKLLRNLAAKKVNYRTPNTSTLLTPLEVSSVVKSKAKGRASNFSLPDSPSLSLKTSKEQEINRKLFKTIFAQSPIKKKKKPEVPHIGNLHRLSSHNIIKDSKLINDKIELIKGKLGFIKHVYDYVYPQTFAKTVKRFSPTRFKLKPVPLKIKHNDIYSLPNYHTDRALSLSTKYLLKKGKECSYRAIKHQNAS